MSTPHDASTNDAITGVCIELILAAQFMMSVMESQGLFDLSERIAVERVHNAVEGMQLFIDFDEVETVRDAKIAAIEAEIEALGGAA